MYEELRSHGHNQFILNKLSKVDADYNYETASDENVFKTSSHIRVNFDEFATEVKKVGLNIKNHVE